MSTIKRILVGMLATVAECTWQVVIQKINISPCTAAVLPEIAQREMVELFMLLVP